MPDGLADLLHEAAVLHTFVAFIEEYCKEQERSQTYVDASGLFFEYVEKLAAGIKQELGSEVDRATQFPARLPVLRRKILTLKYYLRLLHALIKPAADAHTLTIPAPLIDLASQQLQLVEGMKNSSVVILLTPEFMYFHRPHTDIKDQARFVESFIPMASFPPSLGSSSSRTLRDRAFSLILRYIMKLVISCTRNSQTLTLPKTTSSL
jgi:hypothetical protein